METKKLKNKNILLNNPFGRSIFNALSEDYNLKKKREHLRQIKGRISNVIKSIKSKLDSLESELECYYDLT